MSERLRKIGQVKATDFKKSFEKCMKHLLKKLYTMLLILNL